ncbi:VCBS repeat-containing protein [Aegicerativicinus sediminis]|uniref:VCBS repeat-containing protein n=1 Tax=Aegicerativicinus sediminis TaxID=2893202 RepID=UPI001E2BF3EE|nr:VCBS repeat-containing protein [Aegicerativicinus sediminis]
MSKTFTSLVFCLLVLVIFSCKKERAKSIEDINFEPTLFTLLSSAETGIDFLNRVENQKDFNIFKYRNFYNGGGVAIGDINNDGLADIFFTANMTSNKLYLNKGDFQFEDITDKAGVGGQKPWSTGVNMVDINNDGLLDIYVSNAGKMEGNNHDNDLFINNGDLTFTESAETYNLADSGFTIQTVFFDYDKDGDLDAYILNNSNVPVNGLGYMEQRDVRAEDWLNVPKVLSGQGDKLMKNEDGKFTDVSEEAGIYGSLIGFGLGVQIGDVNNDLYPDIYVTNDFYERDYLYINNQDGTFTESIRDYTSHLSLSAMGVDIADINNDSHLDIFVTEMLPKESVRVKSVMEFEGYNVFKLKQSKDFYQQYIQNTLQLNNGNNSFSEIAYFSGVDATDWSWSALMFDMDNDGFKDIFVTNGINHDLTDLDFIEFFADEIIQEMALTGKKEAIDSIIDKMPIYPLPNYAYHNKRNLTFNDVSMQWGFSKPSFSNGAAYGDLDNDGDLDLVINNVNMEAFVYRNNTSETSENNFVKLKFQGANGNKFAIGTKAYLYFGNQIIMQELIPSRGFQSSMEYPMTVGLGSANKIDSIRVVWPNDLTTKLVNISANQTVQLNQSEATEPYKVSQNNKFLLQTLLTQLDEQNLNSHNENSYNDFDYEGLLNVLVSQEGPSLAIGDLNNDGNEDIFVGGAKNSQGIIYLHAGNGKLNPVKQNCFLEDAEFEDTSSAFFDADNDGDLDLIVGSGGNEVGNSNFMKNRLYINDGNGNFIKSEIQLPSNNSNVSVIATEDADGDGDIDLFIGSRSVVGVYGINPQHLYLENIGNGTFKNSTERFAYDIKNSGMITDAKWLDIDGDGKNELITVSDWGSPQIFKNNGRRLSKQNSELDSLTGWWNTINFADFDNDGDLDLVIGNQGKNIHYKPSIESPMRLWINDFDNNGTIEQIMTQFENQKDYPLHQKKDIVGQIVSLKKQNLKASEYSTKSIRELFPEEIISNTIVKEVKYSESIIAINNGNGKFTVKELPAKVQLSCVCGINCTDINDDGNIDLIMGGNNYEYRPQFSRLDASYGHVLLGDGNNNFEWQPYEQSGFFIKGEVKHLDKIRDKHGNSYIFTALNDDKPKVFKINE